MNVAIPHWQNRVSPVFDVARNVLVVEIDRGAERLRRDLVLEGEDVRRRAGQLLEAGTDVLVCGAISFPLEMALSAAGIEVIAHTCGEVEQVLAGFLDGRLRRGAFLMPGCCGRRRQFRRRGGRPR